MKTGKGIKPFKKSTLFKEVNHFVQEYIIERRENDTVVSKYIFKLTFTVESHEAVTRMPSFQHKHETKMQIQHKLVSLLYLL